MDVLSRNIISDVISLSTFSLSQMSKGKLAFTLPWREKVRVSERFR